MGYILCRDLDDPLFSRSVNPVPRGNITGVEEEEEEEEGDGGGDVVLVSA